VEWRREVLSREERRREEWRREVWSREERSREEWSRVGNRGEGVRGTGKGGEGHMLTYIAVGMLVVGVCHLCEHTGGVTSQMWFRHTGPIQLHQQTAYMQSACCRL
jgi:hypothetical protein